MDVALVTGASSGIGLAIAARLVESDYDVYGYARDHGKTSFRHARFKPVECDVTDTRMLLERTGELLKETGGLKVLVNNAGVGFFGPHATMAPGRIERMVRTNLIAPMVLTRAALRHLEASRGYVVNIASTAALNPGPFGAAYGATKAGLHQFGQALFSEVRKSGVRVVTLYPDMTRTPFYDGADFEPGEEPGAHITPECVAGAVAQAVDQREGTVITQIVIRPQRTQVVRKGKPLREKD
ncbi:MAG: SDR family NAD(P)-dependent oxidoreductase [Gemmatimonadetes bacterium]|nr:SDR family NAD(P)-dependent oxidoreductase [Gemmatimonadota bacterium]